MPRAEPKRSNLKRASRNKKRVLYAGQLWNHQMGLAIRQAGPWTALVYHQLHCLVDRAGRFRWRERDVQLQVAPSEMVYNLTRVLKALVDTGLIRKYQAPEVDLDGLPMLKHGKPVIVELGWISTWYGDGNGRDVQDPHPGEPEIYYPHPDDPYADKIWRTMNKESWKGHYVERQTLRADDEHDAEPTPDDESKAHTTDQLIDLKMKKYRADRKTRLQEIENEDNRKAVTI